jgi:hypothetical protein
VLVTFRKTHRRGYAVDISREHGEDLTMNPAPGYDDLLPHDLVHLLVEIHWGLRDGIYGEVAAGGDAGTFRLADERPTGESSREWSRRARHSRRRKGGSDINRSEHLASLVHSRWNARQHGTPLPEWYDRSREAADASESEIEEALDLAAELSARWQRVQIGQGMTIEWRVSRPSGPRAHGATAWSPSGASWRRADAGSPPATAW